MYGKGAVSEVAATADCRCGLWAVGLGVSQAVTGGGKTPADGGRGLELHWCTWCNDGADVAVVASAVCGGGVAEGCAAPRGTGGAPCIIAVGVCVFGGHHCCVHDGVGIRCHDSGLSLGCSGRRRVRRGRGSSSATWYIGYCAARLVELWRTIVTTSGTSVWIWRAHWLAACSGRCSIV